MKNILILLILISCSRVNNLSFNYKELEKEKIELLEFMLEEKEEKMDNLLERNPNLLKSEVTTEKLNWLQLAALHGKSKSFIYFVRSRLPIDKISLDGKSLLLLTVIGDSEEAVSYLLKFHKDKVDINFQDEEGKTALGLAIDSLNYKMVEVLLNNGADPNKKNKDLTPLHLLAEMHPEYPAIDGDRFKIKKILHTLVEKNANLLALNNEEETPFEYSIRIKNEDTFNLFIDLADKRYIGINRVNKKGKSNFYSACKNLKKEALLKFLELNDLEDCITLKGRNSLYAIINNFDKEIFEKIKEKFGYKLSRDSINKLLEYAKKRKGKHPLNNKIKEAINYLENLLIETAE